MAASERSKRLRAPEPEQGFSVVLVEPEIPPNTGNIARLCAATRSTLYLVGKLGFRTDEHAVRRAGLDYWHLVRVLQVTSLEDALSRVTRDTPTARPWLFTGRAATSYLDVAFRPGDALVFGKESTGLSDAVLEAFPDQHVAIPTLGAVRSLNLANAVSIGLYEALRQTGALAGATLRSLEPGG